MQINQLHNWDVSPKEAIEIQKTLSSKLCFTSITKPIKTIAGVDCALTRSGKIVCSAVCFNYETMQQIEDVWHAEELKFPYVPGLLSFREAPACLKAISKLQTTPDVIIVDGQGIAHQRKLGIASHLGLFFNIPTIGCAKSRLVGEYDQPPEKKGNFSPLIYKNEQIGVVLRTRDGVKPLFISPGHLCTIEDSIRITLHCCIKYRLPEPTRIADKLVAQIKTRI